MHTSSLSAEPPLRGSTGGLRVHAPPLFSPPSSLPLPEISLEWLG